MHSLSLLHVSVYGLVAKQLFATAIYNKNNAEIHLKKNAFFELTIPIIRLIK